MSSRKGLPAGLLAALEEAIMARGGRREGQEVRFLCPAHDDHRPSARWNTEKAVWRCDACGAAGGARDLAGRLGIVLPGFSAQAPRETVYVVRDGTGGVVAEHVRIDDAANGKKRFFWRRNGRKGLAGMPASELPLYGAERLCSFDPLRFIFVVEGEKATEALLAIGAQVVGTVTGAGGRPGAGPLEVLSGREVVLWPDADAAGAQHMERIAAAIAGIAASVRIYAPDGLREGGDAVQWIEQRHSAGNPAAVFVLNDLEKFAAELPPRSASCKRKSRPAAACGATVAEPAGDPVEAALIDLGAAACAAETEGPLRQLSEALRGADGLRRAMARERAIKSLKGKVSAAAPLVDAALAVHRPAPAAGQGRAVAFAELEPWPEPVDGADLLRELALTVTRFVALPPLAEVTIALWTVHAHALDAANASPILALISPEKRCGKTTTLSLLARLVPRPLLSSNISPAALFRSVEKYSPTLLVDEADTVLHEKEELRCMLNSGHTRDAAYVVRTVGDDYEPRRFSTWTAKAVALIGRLPDTLADRSLIILMRRRAAHERVERLRLDRPGVFPEHRRAARWAADNLGELRAADPEVPGELGDRAADNWRPLLAIADRAGGEWPERARRAALVLSGAAADGEESIRELLLSDIRNAFREREEIFTDDLLGCLCGREERPWREWKAGRPLSAVQLARLLKPFGVRPGQLRDGARTGKGYEARDFTEAFIRYLPPFDPSQPSQSNAGAGLTDSPTRHSLDGVTARESGQNPYGPAIVTGVTDRNPEPGWVKV